MLKNILLQKICCVFIFIFLLISISCKKKDPVSSQILDPVTIKNSEDITSNETWKSNEIHIITRYIHIKQAVLIIEAGTTIEFRANAGIGVDAYSGIIADGSVDSIRFSSEFEEAGQWKYIFFSDSIIADSCKLINCIIEYGGNDLDNQAIIVCQNSTPVIRGNTIRHSSSNGVLLKDNCRGVEFFNNSITDCAEAPVITSATNVSFVGTNVYENNNQNCIQIISGDISFNDTWYHQPIPLQLINGLSIKSAALTISPDMELRFNNNQSLSISNDGCLKADATLAPITFTSEVNGNWNGIVFEETANSVSSKLVNCIVENGGQNELFPANIVLKQAFPEITGCSIKNSSGFGVYIQGTFSPNSFANNRFENNDKGAISLSAQAVASLNPQNFVDEDSCFVEIRGGIAEGPINFDSRWKNLGVPYKIKDIIQIQYGTVTIDPGTTLLMTESSGFEIGFQGGLIADGSSSLISFQGEDQNHGFWSNIYFAASSNADNCRLIFCQIKHGGGNQSQPGMIYCDNTSPTIRDCFIEYSGTWGIYLNGNSTIADISTNSFHHNLYGSYYP